MAQNDAVGRSDGVELVEQQLQQFQEQPTGGSAHREGDKDRAGINTGKVERHGDLIHNDLYGETIRALVPSFNSGKPSETLSGAPELKSRVTF